MGICPYVRWGGRRDCSQSRDPPSRSRDRLRSREQSLQSSDRLRSVERRRRTRREQQEGVEMVTVSQAPVVSGLSAPVSHLFVRRVVAAFPPAV